MTWVLPALFLLTAALYASVGFGGGSTYNALLMLADVDYRVVPIVALVCNLIVVVGNSIRFQRAKHLDWAFCLPFVVLSAPMAWLGGRMPIDKATFMTVLGACLLLAGTTMLLERRTDTVPKERSSLARWSTGLTLGSAIGFVAGLVGIGGGIFLAPSLHLLRLADPKKIAATASVFIALNSASGLLGQVQKVGVDVAQAHLGEYGWLFVAVLIGGQLGSLAAAGPLSPRAIKKATGVLVLYVGVRLLRAALQV